MQQENKLRYCARATNVRFFTRNTLSRFLTLKHMLATGAKGELETCTLCSIDQTTAMLCSSGSKALTLVSLVLPLRHSRVRSLFASFVHIVVPAIPLRYFRFPLCCRNRFQRDRTARFRFFLLWCGSVLVLRNRLFAFGIAKVVVHCPFVDACQQAVVPVALDVSFRLFFRFNELCVPFLFIPNNPRVRMEGE